jgi:hypothetical protein
MLKSRNPRNGLPCRRISRSDPKRIVNTMKKTLSLVLTTVAAAALTLPVFAQATQSAAGAAKSAASTATTTATKATKAVKEALPPAPTEQEIGAAQAKGLVWVNTNTKVYHTSGAFYGKTKHGKFMTKDEADKAGFKAAKEPVTKAAKTAAKKTATPK